MLEITLPKSRQIEKETLTSTDALDRVLFSQPIWRERAYCALGLSLIEKTRDASKLVIRVSGEEHEALIKACELPGLQVTPPALNRFFLEIVSAIYAAKPLSEDKLK